MKEERSKLSSKEAVIEKAGMDVVDKRKSWRRENDDPSLQEVYKSIPIKKTGSFFRKLLGFIGPGYLVAVGYMDPGNWATSIAGGSAYGYTLLSVILISNLMAILLQALAAKLGIVSGRDLAQACRDHYSKPVSFVLWILCELAIAACDLAEVIGSAIALNLLFNIPLVYGVCITAFDILVVLLLQNKGFRYIESIVIALIVTIAVCFGFEMVLSKPEIGGILTGFIPSSKIISNPDMLYIALGILGATVMPHNLYLHSSIVQTRKYDDTKEGKSSAIKVRYDRFNRCFNACFVCEWCNPNLSRSCFSYFWSSKRCGNPGCLSFVRSITWFRIASILFGVALLASGQNSTLTGTLAGQIVMEGFLNIRLKPWLRRLITRMLAIIPAVAVTLIYGEKGTGQLLILSQVILSLQLSFAVIPLVLFTSDKRKMGEFVNKAWVRWLAWFVTSIIVVLNAYLLLGTFF